MSRAVPGRVHRRVLHAGTPQQRLLHAATDVFTNRGYSAASVREIVERAGVTKPVLYYHFGSKEGVYRALIEHLLAEFEELLGRPAAEPEGSRRRVIELSVNLLAFVEERVDAVRMFYSVYFGAPMGAPYFDFDVFTRRFREVIADSVRAGVESGELRPVRLPDLARVVEAILNSAVESVLFEPDRKLGRKDVARLIDLLFTGAAQPAAAASFNSSRPLKEIPR